MVSRKVLCFAGLLAGVDGAVTRRSDNIEDRQTVTSLLNPGVTLSFKQTHICETTPGVNAYSGYVNIPANPAEGRPYDSHSFFWFFEARNNSANAPLALWLQGGPGVPSIASALGETGPCFVTHNSRDTALNPWSWNNEVNMLYLDQPVQTGFSYDTLINGTVDLTTIPYLVTPLSPSSPPPQTNSTFLRGVFSSQNPQWTANTTANAARAAWSAVQAVLQQYPQYKPKNNKFSIWGESYGGHYVPTFAKYFMEQSQKIAAGTLSNAVPLWVDTVGIISGAIDALTQIQYYPRMAYNNTYGVQVINQTEYNAAMAAFPECQSRIQNCRSLAAAQDPDQLGNVAAVNQACLDAYNYCYANMQASVQNRGRNVYDITSMMPDSFPPRYAGGYLNSKAIQNELGVPLNLTAISMGVYTAFMLRTGDFVSNNNLPYLGWLLDQGVKVALINGDRDYQCNWYGGEAISLAIQAQVSNQFRSAGYAQIQTNSSYVGGFVRQYGNLSFSRVFQAGHEGPWYQPETFYQIFKRVTFNKDVATGTVSTAGPGGSSYSTTGPSDVSNVANAVPVQPVSECYLWAIFLTCTPAQTQMLRNGTAIVRDYIMIGYRSDDGTEHYY